MMSSSSPIFYSRLVAVLLLCSFIVKSSFAFLTTSQETTVTDDDIAAIENGIITSQSKHPKEYSSKKNDFVPIMNIAKHSPVTMTRKEHKRLKKLISKNIPEDIEFQIVIVDNIVLVIMLVHADSGVTPVIIIIILFPRTGAHYHC